MPPGGIATGYNENSNLREQYRAAWGRAEQWQKHVDDDHMLLGVIYDIDERRWIVTCIDTKRWIKEKFHGGHRAYPAEVWRENDSDTILYTVSEQ